MLSTRTRKVNNPASTALRIAAQSLHRSESCLGDFYRRKRYQLGPPKAITATAHKLARIIYHLVSTQQPYDDSILAQDELQTRSRKTRRLKSLAQALGYELVPVPSS